MTSGYILGVPEGGTLQNSEIMFRRDWTWASVRPQELTAVRTIWVPGHTSLGDITLEDAYAGALAILQITVFLPAPPSVEGPEVLREERGLRVYNEPVKCSALTVVF